jgi:rubrerythrin
MATTVGTESNIEDLVTNLVLLERDAIAAYETTIERLDDAGAKQQISEFLRDHQRHLSELDTIAGALGIQTPREGDAKQYLTTGKIALADMMGDGAILKAMKTNEDDTVSAYERASRHGDAIPESRAVFERAHQDELRHRAWMESAAQRY